MVVVALVATMLSNVVATVFEVMHYGILADLDRGVDLRYDEVNDSDIRLLVAYGVEALTYIAAGIAFLAWFHRTYRNLPRLGVWPIRHDVGWAVGAWLIPVFNLVQPKRLFNDAWRGSEPVPGPKQLGAHPHVPAVVHVWWAAWVLVSMLYAIESRIASEVQTLPEQKAATLLAISANVLTVVAGVLAIVVVRMLTERQSEAIERQLATAPPPPPPVPAPPPYAPPSHPM